MSPDLVRTFLAGLTGGAAMTAAMLLTFRLLGFGWEGGGVLLDPALQSPKLIAVWTELEPLPLLALELSFWTTVALADGFAVAAVAEGCTRGTR